ncbi:MAG: hypothetical protein MUE44_30205, partial [Oscillatoriaceae cyanobacterium Prado104]|nr:hypothetical protein [Oscillatoriaceae cyanobacterium Prado104]
VPGNADPRGRASPAQSEAEPRDMGSQAQPGNQYLLVTRYQAQPGNADLRGSASPARKREAEPLDMGSQAEPGNQLTRFLES